MEQTKTESEILDLIESRGVEAVFAEEFERLGVPMCGPASTFEGEVLRAVAKIRYRWFNDGDRIGVGYGGYTTGEAVAFLKKVIPPVPMTVWESLRDAGNAPSYGKEYETHITKLTVNLLVWTLPIATGNLRTNLREDGSHIHDYLETDCPRSPEFLYFEDASSEDFY
jgi:hypothetical protein